MGVMGTTWGDGDIGDTAVRGDAGGEWGGEGWGGESAPEDRTGIHPSPSAAPSPTEEEEEEEAEAEAAKAVGTQWGT